MYEPPPPVKRRNHLTCPVCGEQAASFAERSSWHPLERRPCRACGAIVKPSILALLIPLAVGFGIPLAAIALGYDLRSIYIWLIAIVATLTFLGVVAFDRLRPG
ncbi:MAG TPA: hypothetical protein VGE07_17520 [Herpetosiphonaceae bacterium]